MISKFSYCFIVIIFLSFKAYSVGVGNNSSVLVHYKFLGNTLDSSGNDNHATRHGEIESDFDIKNKIGSYVFDGVDDYIEINTPSSFAFNNESFSISLWVKVKDNDNSYKTFFVISNKNLEPRIELMKARGMYNEGPIYFQIKQDESQTSTAWSKINGKMTPKDTWIHVTGVADYESGELRLYINSELHEAVELTNYRMPQDNLIVRMGQSSSDHIGANKQRHKGSIGEVMVFSRALTSREIKNLYVKFKY